MNTLQAPRNTPTKNQNRNERFSSSLPASASAFGGEIGLRRPTPSGEKRPTLPDSALYWFMQTSSAIHSPKRTLCFKVQRMPPDNYLMLLQSKTFPILLKNVLDVKTKNRLAALEVSVFFTKHSAKRSQKRMLDDWNEVSGHLPF